MRQSLLRGGFAGVVVCTCAPGVHADIRDVEIIARTGQQAPGAPDGATFRTFWNIGIAHDGAAVFSAGLSEESGTWHSPGGVVSPVVQVGDPVPGFPGFHYNSMIVYGNGAGDRLINATLLGTQGGTQSLWLDRGGSRRLLVRAGNQAPGLPEGVHFAGSSWQGALGSAGHIALHTPVRGPGLIPGLNPGAIWATDAAGDLRPVAVFGQTIPNAGANLEYNGPFQRPLIDSTGTVAFRALYYNHDERNGGAAILVGDPEDVTVVARTGLAAPGLPGFAYSDVGDARFSGGHIGFSGTVSNHESGEPGGRYSWAGTPGDLHLVAGSGFSVPGMPQGTVFANGSLLQVGSGGHVLTQGRFRGSASEPDFTWYFTGLPGNIQPVAPIRGQVPGFPDGVVFTSIGLESLHINSRGDVVFTAGFEGPERSGGGVWLREADGDLSLLIAIGDQVEVAPGSFATIASFPMPFLSPVYGTDDSGLPTMMSDERRILQARLDDGSTALLTIAIPAPSTVLCLGLAFLPRRRRSRFKNA